MEQSQTILELAKATSKMQGEMKSVPKDSANPFFKNRYASLDAIWDTIRKPLSSNGLSVIQTTYEQGDKIFLETTLLHSSGEWIRTHLPINATKNDPQAIGSAISYARRYSLSALIGVSSDEEDDGNAASGRANPPPQSKQTERKPEAPPTGKDTHEGNVSEDLVNQIRKVINDNPGKVFLLKESVEALWPNLVGKINLMTLPQLPKSEGEKLLAEMKRRCAK